jgi:phage-related protein
MVNDEKIYFITPEGGTLDLTDGVNYEVRQGIDGRHMPPFDYSTKKVYTYPGEIVQNINTSPREITLPITVKGDTADDFRDSVRMLEYSIDPMRGEGKIKVVTSDTVPLTRLINCHFKTGMSFMESGETGNYKTRLFVITFICHSPYWYDPVETEKKWTNPNGSLLRPQVVYNDGDVDTWPIITVACGSANYINQIIINNETTGKQIKYGNSGTSYLNLNARLYIDCRPGYRSCCVLHWIYSKNALPRSYGNTYCDLWTTSNINFNLVPGENRISFGIIQNARDDSAWASFRWVNRYNGI